MAVYAIGDLQGCYDQFRRLLDKLAFDPDADRLWLVGDLVNRGPKSLKTLRYVKSLGEAAVTVLGNHDIHLLAMAAQGRKGSRSRGGLGKLLAAPDRDELLDWLRRRPLAHHETALDALMVHAGVLPDWSLDKTLTLAREAEAVLAGDEAEDFLHEVYGDRPRRWKDSRSGVARLRTIVNVFTRMRMLAPDGSLDFSHKGPPENAPPELAPWYRREPVVLEEARVVFGHWSALGLLIEERLIGIDTGCVWGRSMTAARLDGALRVVQVDCADCRQ